MSHKHVKIFNNDRNISDSLPITPNLISILLNELMFELSGSGTDGLLGSLIDHGQMNALINRKIVRRLVLFISKLMNSVVDGRING